MREFRLELKSEEFKVGEKIYVMKEMRGTLRDQYNDLMLKRIEVGPDGKTRGMKKVSGIDADLLTRCIVDTETDKFITADVVNNWPAATLEEIGAWAIEFNALDKKAEGAAKNGSGESD
jgi:hypothetical protein